MTWCRNALENGFAKMIELRYLTVYLLDAKGQPLRGWSFRAAHPQSWAADPFQADKSSIAIEKIVLAYASMVRRI